MGYSDSIQEKAEQADTLWRGGDFADARVLYKKISHSIPAPLDKAKMLGNVAQLYEKEGDVDNAINTASAAIKIVNKEQLYKSLEGSHLRGYLNGFINRLQNKDTWEPMPYDEDIPIGLNLNVFDRVRAHFSVTAISGVLFATLSSQANIPSIDIPLFHEKIVVFSLAGFLFSIFFTSGLLQQVVNAIMAFTGRDIVNSLKPAVNLLTFIAVFYLLFMPSVFWSMASELVVFLLTGALGGVVFYGFMFRKHARALHEKP